MEIISKSSYALTIANPSYACIYVCPMQCIHVYVCQYRPIGVAICIIHYVCRACRSYVQLCNVHVCRLITGFRVFSFVRVCAAISRMHVRLKSVSQPQMYYVAHQQIVSYCITSYDTEERHLVCQSATDVCTLTVPVPSLIKGGQH